ncbi:MAG: hypothetical protein ACT4P6_14500, partial [Gemmatimonadaceae bacterium]
MNRRWLSVLTAVLAVAAAGCDKDPTGSTAVRPDTVVLAVAGQGEVLSRFTAEVWVRGTTAYTTTWGSRNSVAGNAIFIWDVSGNTPQLRDSVIIADAGTLGDVQATVDGRYLVVATE